MPRVYLVDERIANSHLAAHSIPDGDLGLTIGPTLSVTEVVGKVLDAMTLADRGPKVAGRPTPDEPTDYLISELRILAYGSGDELFLGWGINPRNAGQMAPLAQYLRTGASGRCLLIGCNVAIDAQRAERYLGGSAMGRRYAPPYYGRIPEEIGANRVPGYALLHAFARTLGVPTTAPLENQTTSYDWQHMGVTMTVDPFGQATFAGMDTTVPLWL